MAANAPGLPPVTKRLSVFVPPLVRPTGLASATSITPSLDGSFMTQQLQPNEQQNPEPDDQARPRRLSSEIDRARPNEPSHYGRSENSSAVVSSGNERFASLAHLVSVMNPLGMETRAKNANHDAIVRHFQLRRVSGEASRLSYAKEDGNDDDDGVEHVTLFGADGSLRRLFAERRLKQPQMLSQTTHRDSLRNVGRVASEVVVVRGSLGRRLAYWTRRLWRRCRRACMAPISPTGTIACIRDVVLFVVVVAQLFNAPFAPVYFPTGTPTTTGLAVIFDLVFLSDMLMSFNTAYYDDKTDRLELNRRKIFKRLLLLRRKRWIALDVLVAIPIDSLLLFTRDAHSSSSLSAALSGEIAWALARLVRWQSLLSHTILGVRVLRVATQLPIRLNLQQFSYSAQLARTLVLFLGATHYVACLWRATLGTDDVVGLDKPWRLYLADLLTSIQLLFGHFVVDAGSHSPPHSPLFRFIAMLIGAFVMAFVTSSVALLLLRINSNSSRYETKLAGVFTAMAKMQLPPKLRRRIHQYYDHLWVAHDATDASEITAFSRGLSSSLSLEVNLFKYMDLVLSVPFWRNCSADFVTQIMLNLEVRTYLPEDYVMRQGEIGTTLFLVNRGLCELRARVDEDEDEVAKPLAPRTRRLHAGAAFGELALLMNYRRTASVRAVTFVEMCLLERVPFQAILTRYRDDRREVLREILMSCVEKKTQRFVPFPYEPLVASATGGTDPKPLTPWEAAEILVERILAPECVDESIKFGFKDLDAIAQHQLIPVAEPSDPRSAHPVGSPKKLAKRLESIERWQAETTTRLAGLELGMESILRELTSLSAALNRSPTVAP